MNLNLSDESKLIEAMSLLDEEAVKRLVSKLVAEGYDTYSIFKLLDRGVQEVGTLFENGDYFIADLIAAGSLYSDIVGYYNLFPSSGKKKHLGDVLIGVVAHDIHDIGKDIVASLLRVEGFEVVDLGTDVSAERFVAEALQYRPNVIALCGMLYYSAIEMEKTVRAMEKAGVRDFATTVIGGGCVNEAVFERVKADAYFFEPLDMLEFCKTLVRRSGEANEKQQSR